MKITQFLKDNENSAAFPVCAHFQLDFVIIFVIIKYICIYFSIFKFIAGVDGPRDMLWYDTNFVPLIYNSICLIKF